MKKIAVAIFVAILASVVFLPFSVQARTEDVYKALTPEFLADKTLFFVKMLDTSKLETMTGFRVRFGTLQDEQNYNSFTIADDYKYDSTTQTWIITYPKHLEFSQVQKIHYEPLVKEGILNLGYGGACAYSSNGFACYSDQKPNRARFEFSKPIITKSSDGEFDGTVEIRFKVFLNKDWKSAKGVIYPIDRQMTKMIWIEIGSRNELGGGNTYKADNSGWVCCAYYNQSLKQWICKFKFKNLNDDYEPTLKADCALHICITNKAETKKEDWSSEIITAKIDR